MSTVKTIWDGLDWTVLTDALLSLIPALLCITLHELSHGYVAFRLGDDTAKKAGRLTLNPLRHIDWMGLAMMVVFKFGWAKPVPVNMYRFRNPKRGMAVTALAGPVCNLLLCVVFLFLYGACYPLLYRGAVGVYLLRMLQLTAYISLALAVFNVLPVPPLDGSKVLFSLIPDQAYYRLMRYERYGMIALLLLVASGVLGTPLARIVGAAFNVLFAVAEWGFQLTRGLV